MTISSSTYHLYRILLICLIWIAAIDLGTAQNSDTQQELSKKEINDLVDLAKYNKKVRKLKSKKSRSTDQTDLEKINPEDEEEIELPKSNFSFGGGAILKFILYAIIAALVVFLLVAIFSSIKIEKKIENKVITKNEEIEDIEVIDAETGLEEALKLENYREAVRMLFIKLLQVLVLEKSIAWKPEKTNRDYLREMRGHPKIQHFNNLVIAYERIWYGRADIDKPFFEYLRADFEKFYSTENITIDVKE